VAKLYELGLCVTGVRELTVTGDVDALEQRWRVFGSEGLLEGTAFLST
jgi:hypothetical protein